MISAEKQNVVAQFMLRVTIPILCKRSKGIDHIATGTLFEIDDCYYLVTAAHVFDDWNAKNFTIPNDPNGSNLRPLGRFILHKFSEEAIDIAVLELQDSATINAVKKGWVLLKPAHTALASPEGVFILAGYPSEWIKVADQRLTGTLITAYTVRLNEVPEDASEPIHTRLDLFFHHAKEATDANGKPLPSPDLGGTSGSSVWEYYERRNQSVWTPENSLRIIGVQVSCRKGRYIRAKSWQFVFEILRKIHPRPLSVS
jgi:hypothetical protein